MSEPTPPGHPPAAVKAPDLSTPEHPAPPVTEPPSRSAADVGLGISAAAANPGTSAARNDQVREARRSFGRDLRIDGEASLRDAINGNVYNVFHGKPTTSGLAAMRLAAEFLAECRETFVPPSDATAAHSWAQRRLVILRAPEGWGKEAHALWLLTAHEPPDAVLRLDPETRLRGLSASDLARSTGYLLADLPPAQASALTAFDLERLAAEVARLGGRMIVTVRQETTFTDGGISRYVVDLGARVDPRDVFDKHLRRRLRDRPGLADRLLGRPDVRQLLERELTPDVPLAKAADLARLIADEADRPDDVVAGVRDRLTRSDQQDFTSWFNGLNDLHLQCFAIALSIFNGLPYETVADTGLQLHRKFDMAGGTAVATRAVPEAASPFGDGRASRLRTLRARVGKADVTTPYGTVTAEVVRYADATFPVRVLRHVWQEHDRARGGVIAWLRDLGGHPDQTVRIRAATAVGVLTAIAYDHMRHEVLARWARSRDPEHREAAAIALVGPAEDYGPALAGAVRNLVAEWAQGSAELKATAARAYGANTGLVPLDVALGALEKLSGEDDFDVVEAVCLSLTDLVAARDGAAAGPVLGLIRVWSASRQDLRPVVAHLAFMFVAADLVVERPSARGPVTWPTLLWLAYCDRELHRVLAGLWGWSLNSAEFSELALTVLDEWAAMVERDESARQAFVGLVTSACVHSRVPARLRRHVPRWTKPDSKTKAERTARELLAVLPQGVTHR
ncbi:hypothetical protein [Saccharothrix hoggarensis]|uniref:HEAT repeat protein n=1 Tax=Saccharothrix hoggarensis TaxID=913853 RepID=A0ABW3R384_9PSEU